MRLSEYTGSLVTMEQVLARYHHPGKNGRTSCPLHGGVHNNLAYTDSVFYCWTCGAKGNVLGFVAQLFGVDREQAAEILNRDFGLSVPVGHKAGYRDRERIRRAARDRQAAFREREQRRAEQEAAYWVLLEEWITLDRVRRICRPSTPGELWGEAYCYAVQRLPAVEYRLDCTDWK